MITYVTPTGDVKEIELAQLLEQKPYTLLYFYPKNDTP
jgi:peroxiredoxin